MQSDRRIGKVVSVNSYSATIELDKDAQSFVKNSFEETHKIGIINSYLIIPIGADKIVGIVTKVNMFEDSELNYKSASTVVLPKSKRTMTVTMIGSIVSKVKNDSEQKISLFEYGIVGYPSLDNEVWSIAEDELNIIFKVRSSDKQDDKKFIQIGTSTVFPDYPVVIDMDKFFGKHAAILGNTGSGKSCTVTAIIRSVLEDKPEMQNAHFIIFDTNNEYENAFTIYVDNEDEKTKKILFDRFVIRDEGLQIPSWFMNGQDFEALFTPGEQIQAPILSQAIIRARNSTSNASKNFILFHGIMNHTIITLREFALRTQGTVTHDIRNQCEPFSDEDSKIISLMKLLSAESNKFDINQYKKYFQQILTAIPSPGTDRSGNPNWVQPNANQILIVNESCNEIENLLRQQIEIYGLSPNSSQFTADTPSMFDFEQLLNRSIEEEIQDQERTAPRVRNDIGTLLLRMNRMFQDPKYAFIFKVKPFNDALSLFLRYIFGEITDDKFVSEQIPWSKYYHNQLHSNQSKYFRKKITIIDFSNIASDVLENMTALVGRLIFEFMQRVKPRGSFPTVLVLEEAHHYIPNDANIPRQRRARQVFERISKEGRKFGLSMLIASQRPSELSRTIMAQCNSFIVHRIQNPEDQQYFKSVISSVSHDLLNQLPTLPQQSALVMGDCVTAPIQVTIRDVDPKPDSRDPKFSTVWSDPKFKAPDFEAICKNWEEGN